MPFEESNEESMDRPERPQTLLESALKAVFSELDALDEARKRLTRSKTMDPMDEEKNVFRKEYRELTENEKTDMLATKDLAGDLYRGLETIASHGADPRMVALAKTKLEECVMWAVKAITG